MELKAEKMQIKDIPAVAALEQLCFAQPWSEKALEESLQNPDYVFFAARCECVSALEAGEEPDDKACGELVGYAGAYQAADELSITNIAVFPQWRRCGAANCLLKALDTLARERRLYGITLEVRVSNSAAIALYEKNGYEKSGIRKGFYSKPKEDALIMWKYFQQ